MRWGFSHRFSSLILHPTTTCSTLSANNPKTSPSKSSTTQEESMPPGLKPFSDFLFHCRVTLAGCDECSSDIAFSVSVSGYTLPNEGLLQLPVETPTSGNYYLRLVFLNTHFSVNFVVSFNSIRFEFLDLCASRSSRLRLCQWCLFPRKLPLP